MATAIIKLHCKDVEGVVYNVSKFIFEAGGNIIESRQYKEELDDLFFMRVHFDLSKVTSSRPQLEKDFAQVADKFGMDNEISYSDNRKRMAIMVSKYDHCLYDLFLRHQYGEMDADIALVVSNHPDLQPVAAHFNTPYFHIPVDKESKEEAEEKALELFRQHQVDFVVLARYMQILTPVLLEAYPNRVINVHHGFLPAFVGGKAYHQAYEKGVKIIGATMSPGTWIWGPSLNRRLSASIHLTAFAICNVWGATSNDRSWQKLSRPISKTGLWSTVTGPLFFTERKVPSYT